MNLLYIFSDVDSSLLIEGNIRFIDHERFRVKAIFLAKRVPRVYEDLRSEGFDVEFIRCRGKIDVLPLVWKLARRMASFRPNVVHTNLFHASIAGLIAAWIARVPIRVNTRHHSIETHLYHPHAVWYDRFVNRIATHIVAITDQVAEVLVERENVSKEKVTVIHHGLDLDRFNAALDEPSDLRSKYGLSENYPVIGVISRFIHWKGIQYVIPAFRDLLYAYPNAKLVIANAQGPYEAEIQESLTMLDRETFVLIPYERDVLGLYKAFDVFVHVPIGEYYEAFGQVYIEALAMGVPSVFTISGVAADFVQNGSNAKVVDYQNSEDILVAISSLLANEKLREDLKENGKRDVRRKFDIKTMCRKLENLYSSGLLKSNVDR